MPIYEYDCSCGRFEAVRSYDDSTIACPRCGGTAKRVPVYRSQGLIVRDGPNAPMPPRSDTQTVQEETRKALAKRNWTAERAVEELRATRFTDEQGQLRIDTRKMTQQA